MLSDLDSNENSWDTTQLVFILSNVRSLAGTQSLTNSRLAACVVAASAASSSIVAFTHPVARCNSNFCFVNSHLKNMRFTKRNFVIHGICGNKTLRFCQKWLYLRKDWTILNKISNLPCQKRIQSTYKVQSMRKEKSFDKVMFPLSC